MKASFNKMTVKLLQNIPREEGQGLWNCKTQYHPSAYNSSEMSLFVQLLSHVQPLWALPQVHCSGFPYPPESAQPPVRWVSDAIQPSHLRCHYVNLIVENKRAILQSESKSSQRAELYTLELRDLFVKTNSLIGQLQHMIVWKIEGKAQNIESLLI